MSKKRKAVVAAKLFADSVTGKDYRKGEEVTDWDEEREKHYIDRGLLEVVEIEEASAPGPSENAAQTGPTVKK